MTRRALLPALILLCALAAGTLAACGGGDDEDASAILAETFGAGKDVKSGRLDLSFRLNAQGAQNLQGPVGLRLAGPFQSSGSSELPRFDFDLDVDAGGQRISAGAVSTGDKGFLRFQDQPYELGEQLYEQFKRGYAEQAKCNEQRDEGGEGGVSFRSLGIDPARWLRQAETAGSAKVGGADTTHIRAGVDVPRMLEDVNKVLGRADNVGQADPCAEDAQPEQPRQGSRQLPESTRKTIADSVKDARVDVWTGEDDRILRRLNITVRFDVPEDKRAQANGLRAGDLRFDMTIGALNKDQRIAAPSGAQPLEQLVAQFGGQVPGLGDGSGGAAPGAAPGGSAGGAQGGGEGAQSSEYLRCVEQAGEDVVRLQECAELIGR